MAKENEILELINNKYKEIEQNPNIFIILKADSYEIRHSDFLAWLFDPNENHGLKNHVFKTFIKGLFEKPKAGFVHECEIFNNEDEFDDEFGNLEVHREFIIKKGDDKNNGKIDLVIKSKNYLWVIENKYGANETKQVRKNSEEKEVIGQLSIYKDYIENECNENGKFRGKKPVFIYLDIDRKKYTEKKYYNKGWSLATYDDNILPCLSEIINNNSIKNKCNPKALVYIKDYDNIIKTKYCLKLEIDDITQLINVIKKYPKSIEKYKKYSENGDNIIHDFIWWTVPNKYGKIIEELTNEFGFSYIDLHGWREKRQDKDPFTVTRIYNCELNPINLSFDNHVQDIENNDEKEDGLYLTIKSNGHEETKMLLKPDEYFSSACISDDELKKILKKKLNQLLKNTRNMLRNV